MTRRRRPARSPRRRTKPLEPPKPEPAELAPAALLSGAVTAGATVTGTLTTQILFAGAIENTDAAAYRKIRAAQQEARAARRLEWRTQILAVHDALLRQRAASGRASRRWSVRQQARMVHARLDDLADGDARVPSLELIRKTLIGRSPPPA